MRTTIPLIVVALAAAGCSANPTTSTPSAPIARSWKAEASALGVSEGEITQMANDAASRYKMTAWCVERFGKGTDAVGVYLTDGVDQHRGVIAVFRKVEGQWQEDPKAKGE